TPLFVDSLRYFRHIEREIENRWVIYNLEVMSRRSGDYLVLRRRNAQTVNENLFFAERVDWISVEAHGTAGYYITARAARNMVSEEKISASADIWSFHARRGNGKILVSVPCSVLHPPDQSTGYLEERRRMEELRAYKERGAIEKLFRYIR